MKPKYIEWTKKSIEEWLSDKFNKRGLNIDEYVTLTKFLREDYKPNVVVDVGTFLGASGYILGTASPNLEHLYAIEHNKGPTFEGPYKRLVTEADYGKYLPEYCIFKEYGYEYDLPGILESHRDDDVFVFFDAGKNSLRIMHQCMLARDYGIKYIGFHDTNIPSVKRVINRAIHIGLYRKVLENIGDGKSKGIVILELVNK